MRQLRVVVVGCGGIGGWLIEPLARYLNYSAHDLVELHLVDGDAFEPKNSNRQLTDEMTNKAEVVARRVKKLDKLSVRVRPFYLVEDNIGQVIQEGDVVCLCVDNDATRLLVHEHVTTLSNVTVISGANDTSTGSLQVFVKRAGQDRTLPLLNKWQPRIAHPQDENPGEVQARSQEGCDRIVQTTPQLICANLTAAALMLNAACTILDDFENFPAYDESQFDCRTNNVRSTRRPR